MKNSMNTYGMKEPEENKRHELSDFAQHIKG
jgi:hypothetical protein